MRTVWIVIIATTLLPVTASADFHGKIRQLRGEYVSRELQVCAQVGQEDPLIYTQLRNTIRTIERVYDGKGGGKATMLTQNILLLKRGQEGLSENPFRDLFVRPTDESECDIVVEVKPDLSVVETLTCEGLTAAFRFSTTRQGQLTRNRSVMNYGVNPAERQVIEFLNPDGTVDQVFLRDCIIEGTAIKKTKGDLDDKDDKDDKD